MQLAASILIAIPRSSTAVTTGPSDAVEILGLQTVPGAGDEFRVFQGATLERPACS